jgi:hypothetical protein
MFETGYTHYLWGNYACNDEKNDTWYGIYLARAIYRYTPNRYAILMPLTSPYGPGSLWGKLVCKFIIPDINLQAGAELLLLFNNRSVNLVETPYRENSSLKSFNQWFVALDLPVSYKWQDFRFSLTPVFLFSENRNAFQLNLGINWSREGKRFF